MEKKLPGIIIFVAGFVTMAFEVSGSRVLGPYFGTSIFVWTSLIGTVMGSLSLGYWIGGRISIQRTDFWVLALILVFSALYILIIAIGNMYILDRVLKYIPGVRLRIVISTILLFGPASVGFGMILPYAVKLRIQTVKSSGGTVGNFYATSSVGSILGTFAAGFLLIPFFGYSQVLFILSLVLLLMATATLFVQMNHFTVFATSAGFLLLMILWIRTNSHTIDYIDVDTQYNRVLIYETNDHLSGRPIKMLRVNDENSSAMFLDEDNDLVFEVLKYYRLMEHFVPDFNSALMIGGSGYAFPKDYLKRYPGAKIDVVEIDPGLTELARKHFELREHSDLEIFHEDGRTFLNDNDRVYDAVLMDAYKSMITIPYQLTTREAVQKIYDALSPEGVVLANVISSLNPENNQFLMSELATYQSVFPQVFLFAVQYPDPTEEQKKFFQNFMLVGMKSVEPVSMFSSDSLINNYLQHYYPIVAGENEQVFTDEYAPVEYMASKALN